MILSHYFYIKIVLCYALEGVTENSCSLQTGPDSVMDWIILIAAGFCEVGFAYCPERAKSVEGLALRGDGSATRRTVSELLVLLKFLNISNLLYKINR